MVPVRAQAEHVVRRALRVGDVPMGSLTAGTAGRATDFLRWAIRRRPATYVNDVLRTGLVPAGVRAVLYQALALLPDLTVTQREANLAGRVGVALGVDDPSYPTRDDIIVDPTTGRYIGERTVQLRAEDGVRAGMVTEFSAVTTVVAQRLGARPK